MNYEDMSLEQLNQLSDFYIEQVRQNRQASTISFVNDDMQGHQQSELLYQHCKAQYCLVEDAIAKKRDDDYLNTPVYESRGQRLGTIRNMKPQPKHYMAQMVAFGYKVNYNSDLKRHEVFEGDVMHAAYRELWTKDNAEFVGFYKTRSFTVESRAWD